MIVLCYGLINCDNIGGRKEENRCEERNVKVSEKSRHVCKVIYYCCTVIFMCIILYEQ